MNLTEQRELAQNIKSKLKETEDFISVQASMVFNMIQSISASYEDFERNLRLYLLYDNYDNKLAKAIYENLSQAISVVKTNQNT